MTARTVRSLAAVAVAAGVVAAGLSLPTTSAASPTYTSHFQSTAPVVVEDSTKMVGSTSIGLPDWGMAGPYPSKLVVTDRPGVISHVQVLLNNLEHPHVDDLDILLLAPGGEKVMLLSDAGGGEVYASLTFDADAPSAAPDNGPLESGLYRAADYEPGDSIPFFGQPVVGTDLSILEGTNPNGEWRLFVVDDSDATLDYGTIGSWKLKITTTASSDPFPSPVAVEGVPGVVTAASVTLTGLTHPYAEDLDVMLVGPGGQAAMLMSDIPGAVLADAELTIAENGKYPILLSNDMLHGHPDDVDTAAFPDNTDRFPGVLDDTGTVGASLSVFDGTDPNGLWNLYVVDDSPQHTGILSGGWTLHLDTELEPEPTPDPTPDPTPGADDTAPRVVARTPSPQAGAVRRGADLAVSFSEPMRARTLDGRTVWLKAQGSGTKVRATVRYHRDSRTATLDPRRRLAADTTYRLVVSTAAKDKGGHRLDQRPGRVGLQRYASTLRTR